MTTFNHKHSFFLRTTLVSCVMMTMAGCGSPLTNTPDRIDPRLQHPIQVAREQVSVTIDLPFAGNALSPENMRRLQGFIRNFASRGRTSITVESQMNERAREILLANGLRANEIILVPETTIKAPSAIMTFTANVAKVPTCGNWSENVTFNPTNNPSPDFGCSTRRNLGLTVADPGDMIESQPMSGHGAARRDAAVDSYNSGAPFKQPVIDTQAVSGTKN